MINRDERTKKIFGLVRIIAGVMLVVAPIIYAVVPYVTTPMNPVEPGGPKMLVYLLLIVAVSAPMLYPIIERAQISSYRKLGDKSKMSPMQMYFSQQITRFALTEAIFILGLVVFYITGRQDWFWYFYPIGVFWVVMAWPTEARLEAYLRRVEGP